MISYAEHIGYTCQNWYEILTDWKIATTGERAKYMTLAEGWYTCPVGCTDHRDRKSVV